MKRNIVLLLAMLALGTIGFSENHTIGVDIAIGFPLGFSRFTPQESIEDVKIKLKELNFGMKIQTYSCFLFKKTLGIYASAGFGAGLGLQTQKLEEVVIDDGGIVKSGDFMAGLALGANAGRLRFQTGLAFHAVISKLNSFLYEGNYRELKTYGFAFTPQVRVAADKRCSFVVGADFMFDFPKTISSTDSYGIQTDIEYDDGFRFGCTPYLGLGINFGR